MSFSSGFPFGKLVTKARIGPFIPDGAVHTVYLDMSEISEFDAFHKISLSDTSSSTVSYNITIYSISILERIDGWVLNPSSRPIAYTVTDEGLIRLNAWATDVDGYINAEYDVNIIGSDAHSLIVEYSTADTENIDVEVYVIVDGEKYKKALIPSPTERMSMLALGSVISFTGNLTKVGFNLNWTDATNEYVWIGISALKIVSEPPIASGLYGIWADTSGDNNPPNMSNFDSWTALESGNYSAPIQFDNHNPSGQGDYYAWRLWGWVYAPNTENYTFYVESDDGQRLWVNDECLIDNWIAGLDEKSGTIKLVEGYWYPILIEGYEATGNQKCYLKWSTESISKGLIPADYLHYVNNTVAMEIGSDYYEIHSEDLNGITIFSFDDLNPYTYTKHCLKPGKQVWKMEVEAYIGICSRYLEIPLS